MKKTINGNIIADEKDANAWRLRLAVLQQETFFTIKTIGRDGCTMLHGIVNRQWLSVLDPTLARLEPDGTVSMGAPSKHDLALRRQIVSEVTDGLKTRPRPGHETPCSLFKIHYEDYTALVALCHSYEQLEQFINSTDEFDSYRAAALATQAATLVDAFQYLGKYSPLNEDDLESCEI